MARVYLATTATGDEVGLFERPHESVLRFAVTRNGKIILTVDNLREAYLEYNAEVMR